MGRWSNIPVAGAYGGCVGASVPAGEMSARVPAREAAQAPDFFKIVKVPIGGASVQELANGTPNDTQPHKQPPKRTRNSKGTGFFKEVRTPI